MEDTDAGSSCDPAADGCVRNNTVAMRTLKKYIESNLEGIGNLLLGMKITDQFLKAQSDRTIS